MTFALGRHGFGYCVGEWIKQGAREEGGQSACRETTLLKDIFLGRIITAI